MKLRPFLSLPLAAFVLATNTPSSCVAADAPLLEQLAEVDYATEDGALKHQILSAMATDLFENGWESALLQIASDPTASLDGRQLAGELLKSCVSASSIETLIPLLSENSMSAIARDLLAGLPGESVDQALIDALGKTEGRYQAGIASTLAKRQVTRAISALSEVAQNSIDPDAVAISLRAIGQIGGKEATSFFAEHADWLQQPAPIATAFAEGALFCLNPSEGSDSSTRKTQDQVARELAKSAPSSAQRTAALIYLQQANPSDVATFMSLMASNQPELHQQAAAILPYLNFAEKSGKALMKAIPGWDTDAQQLTLMGLMETSSPFAIKVARNLYGLVKDDESLTRSCMEVMKKLGALQDAELLLPLTLEKSEAAAYAKEVIGNIPDVSINDWVMSQFENGEDDTKGVMLEVMNGRCMRASVEILLSKVDSFSPGVSKQVFRLAGDIGTVDTVKTLMKLLYIRPTSLQNEVDRAIVDIGRRFPTPIVSEQLIAQWKTSTGDDKNRLLRMICAMDQPPSVELLHQMVMQVEPDPVAMRALAASQSLQLYPTLKAFLLREDITEQQHKDAWNALFRITKDAIKEWREERMELWGICSDTAPGTEAISRMLDLVEELKYGYFIYWLETLDSPENETRRQSVLELVKHENGK